MKIITGNAALRQCIPNTLATAAGEATWFQKLYPYLEEAEEWLEQNITGESLLSDIQQTDENDRLKQLCARIITCQALLAAVPSLDLVLTPNGFGIVNTQNIAPASKERIERLLETLEKERDGSIEMLLIKLQANEIWRATEQGIYFASTLFPRLSLVRMAGFTDHRWQRYQEFHSKLIKIENSLAEEYFSQNLMTKLRNANIGNDSIDAATAKVIHDIQALEIMLLNGNDVCRQSFYDIINIIRGNPERFPEWHASKTAELFQMDSFKNKKESSGYWF